MTHPSRLLACAGLLTLAVILASPSHAAWSDPSGRIARLSDVRGELSYSPAGEDDWVQAGRNRPLTRGDRLWTDRGARAELQIGSAALRLGPDTAFSILELDDRIAQVEITQGTLNLGVRRLQRGQSIEVATPMLAFLIRRPGRYRVDVDAEDGMTTLVVWEGAGEAIGQRGSFPLRAGDAVSFYSTDLRDHQLYALPQADAFDRYCMSRDRRLRQSQSLRYVDDDLVGYADLDEYGSWRSDREYGNVWYPSQVRADWAPYRDGHWVWQEPWGWTWVDDAPWGFAPSHYGRWVSISGRWGWTPGPRNRRPVYAPALVAFIGGSGWNLSLNLGSRSRIGWFPLGPREVYMPSYQASREYFTQVNVSNTVINNTVITNVYNNYASGDVNVAQVNYANRGLVGAITAVPGDVFRSAQPVAPAAFAVDQRALANVEILRLAPIAPSEASVTGRAPETRAQPEAEVFERSVYAHSKPPSAVQPFVERQQQLERNPGRAIEPPTGNRAPGAEENVRVVAAQSGAADARAAGSRFEDATPPESGKPPQLRPLDRTAERPPSVGRNRDDPRRVEATPPATAQQAPAQNLEPKPEPSAEQAAVARQRAQQAELLQAQQQREAEEQQRQAQGQAEQAAVARQRAQQAEVRQAQQQREADEQQRQAQGQAEQAAVARQRAQQAEVRQAQQQREAEEQQRQAQGQAEQAAVARQRAQQAEGLQAQQQRQREADEQQRQAQGQAEQAAVARQRAHQAEVLQTQQQREADELTRQAQGQAEQAAAARQRAEQAEVQAQQQNAVAQAERARLEAEQLAQQGVETPRGQQRPPGVIEPPPEGDVAPADGRRPPKHDPRKPKDDPADELDENGKPRKDKER